MTRCFITTVDNPYDPCDQFDQWYRFDCDHGYNSCGLLARIAYTSSQLTDNENAYEIELAIDQIIKSDPLNLYRKVKKTLPDTEKDTDAA